MKEFITPHKVFLTPISPIHIGCGEDFEPTNYVIDDKVLYHFEPSKLLLSEGQKKELLNLSTQEYVDETQLFELQAFFAKNDELINSIKDIAHYKIPVSTAITKEWKEKVGSPTQIKNNGKKEGNRFYIARHSYSPFLSNAYIPGSSIKGAVFSSIIQSEYQNKPFTDKDLGIDKELGSSKRIDNEIFSAANKKLIHTYIGNFNSLNNEKIISQYIKFSDLMPNKIFSQCSKVMYALNIKRTKGKKGYLQGVSSRMECIQPELYRGFKGELTLTDASPKKTLEADFHQKIIKMLNDFYRPIFDKECQLFIQNGFINSLFVENINLLLDRNNIALIRLGKNGSESKLLTAHSLRKINIKGEYKEQSNTFWLASERNDVENQLQPLGWALLEFSPTVENEMLQQWTQNPNRSLTLFMKNKEAEQKEQALLQEKAQVMSQLSDIQRKVIELEDQFKSSSEKEIDSSSLLYKNVKLLIEEASSWSNENKQFMAERITKELIKSRIELKKKNAEKDLNKLLNKLGTP